MAFRKNARSQVETITFQVPAGSDLLSRIEKISAQTGLGTQDLFQKWVLQEESLIGLMRRGQDPAAEEAEMCPDIPAQQIPDVQEQEETVEVGPDSPNYRKNLIERVKKLKKEGTTLVRIAEIFNEENVQTVSGKGKWYSSSIINLLNSKM
jgi:hypothetical protein